MWSETVGFVNGQYKYLTAETFGYKINANGATLKKKQQWTIEPFPIKSSESNGKSAGNGIRNDDLDDLEHVAIKSHLNCYLAVDSFGNVTCDSQEKSEGARFTITICSMSQGPGQPEQISWAFRNVVRGYYLGATTEGMITCNAKMPQSRAELWHVHLLPARGATMFALKSVGRKRYARALPNNQSQNGASNVKDENEQIQVDATTPWGSETLFQFKYYEGGKYALLTSNCKYLTSEGNCIELKAGSGDKANGTLPPKECLFTIEYHGGHIAFRDSGGRYLAAAGRASLLRTRSTTVSKDELFEFEQAPIQLALRATFNNKWVSIKQGVDVSANQNEITSQHETFQLEYNQISKTWHIVTESGSYWSLGGIGTIQASSKDVKSRGHFRLKWNNDDGTCSISAASEPVEEAKMKWVCGRKSGQLYLGTADPVKFHVKFENRTAFNLRGSNASGFVGLKLPGAGKLESNKTTPDSIIVEYANSESNDENVNATFNCVFLKMIANNKYWSIVDGNIVVCDASSSTCAQQWQLELRNGTCLAIRTFESRSYLNLNNNGTITVSSSGPDNATLWEF